MTVPGCPWDAESQTYSFPYRYYSPNMNRWTSPDPAELIDGPNIYAYVKGKAIVSYDALGLFLDQVFSRFYNYICGVLGVCSNEQIEHLAETCGAMADECADTPSLGPADVVAEALLDPAVARCMFEIAGYSNRSDDISDSDFPDDVIY